MARGDVVWVRWYHDPEVAPREWRRATGRILQVGADGGVRVGWPARGRSRSTTDLTAAECKDMVPAGMLEDPATQLRAEQLVERRVEVYWAGRDTFFGGRIASYDPARNRHVVEYDGGITQEVALGSRETPHYVVERGPLAASSLA